jgi:hypothetical protein
VAPVFLVKVITAAHHGTTEPLVSVLVVVAVAEAAQAVALVKDLVVLVEQDLRPLFLVRPLITLEAVAAVHKTAQAALHLLVVVSVVVLAHKMVVMALTELVAVAVVQQPVMPQHTLVVTAALV